MQVLQLSPWQALLRSSRLVLQAAPRRLLLLTSLNLIQGIGSTTIVLFFSKVTIDEIARLLNARPIEPDQALATILSNSILLISICGVIFLSLLLDALGTVTNVMFSGLQQQVQGHIQKQVLYKIATFADIALFENPELLNIVQLAEKAVGRLQVLSIRLGAMIVGLFTLVPAAVVAVTIAWWLPVIILCASAPLAYTRIHYVRQSWNVEKTQASAAREMQIFKQMLSDSQYAKELRLYSLQNLLLKRWNHLFGYTFKQMEEVRMKGSRMVIAWSLLSGLGVALPYIYVVMGTLSQTYTLGDLALYGGLVLRLRQGLSILIGQTSDLYDVALGTTPIFQLLELEPQLQRLSDSNSSLPVRQPQARPAVKLELQNVCFSYPGSDRPSLENINLTILPGQTVALVGENGAGKTTLAKLLCRLYDPNQGKILWNGADLRSLELEDLRQRIAVVLQDYARFPVTVRENIAFGNLSQLDQNPAILNALDQAGMTDKVQSLPNQLETPLGKQLEGGVDLSGGQWQRVAIARSLIRQPQAELLIFDEPTAALDPKTEDEIYRLFEAIAQDRTAVVVTHRLALARIADIIVVLEQGKIVEMGSHTQLMEQGEQYYEMFTRQARSYV